MESGYSSASMDAVASRAGVSKATIYVHFANKRALFEAIIRRRAEAVFGQLEFSESTTDVRQSLLDLGASYISLLMNPDALAMYRVVLAEANQQPEVGEAFYLGGPAYARRRVGDYFVALSRNGRIAITEDEAPLIADLFLSMLAGDCHLRALFGKSNDELRVRRMISCAVDLVMGRCAV